MLEEREGERATDAEREVGCRQGIERLAWRKWLGMTALGLVTAGRVSLNIKEDPVAGVGWRVGRSSNLASEAEIPE